MQKYTVKLKSVPKGHKVPALLSEFGKWLAKQKYGSVGWFDMVASAVPGPLGNANPKQLKKDAWCFACLPDGSLLALLTTRKPAAVVLFGSEGETKTVATSLEGFLVALSRAKTRVDDLDDNEDDENDQRLELAAWLKARKVRVPAAAKFLIRSYLASIKLKPAKEPAAAKKLPPNIRTLVGLLGHSVEDPSVVKELQKLKLKAPRTKRATVLGAKKRGIAIRLENIKQLNAEALTVTEVTLSDDYDKPLPFKLDLSFNKFTLKKLLGKPTGKTKDGGAVWQKLLDKGTGLYFELSRGHFDCGATLRLFIKVK